MFFKKKEVKVLSPVKGKLISIKDVPDMTFSEEMIGKGVAIIPEGNEIYSPVDGKVTTVFITGHAIGITTKEGVDLLIHIGIDTVNLKGEGFEVKVKDGEDIKAGTLLLVADFNKIKENGYTTETPIVVCNPDDFKSITNMEFGNVEKGDVIMKIQI